jgi:YfiH family protein
LSRVTSSVVAFQFHSLLDRPVIHGMSGRVRNAGLEGDVGHGRDTVPDIIEANRSAFLHGMSLDPASLTMGRQTHSATVEVVQSRDVGRGRYPLFDGFPATDALVTDVIGATLGVIVADCVPVLLYDPVQHILGLAHAGWRGTVGRIAGRTVDTMRESFGSNPSDVVAAIGPSIGPCCYEVGEEVVSAWNDAGIPGAGAAVQTNGASYHLDLWTANRLVLVAAGVAPDMIETSDICVRCNVGRFFSYRAARQGLAAPGRMLMVAQLSDRTTGALDDGRGGSQS